MIPGNANPLLLASAAADAAAAGPIKSVRFNDDDSAYLSKTFSSSGNQKTYTMSLWVKRSTLGKSYQSFLSNPNSSGINGVYFGFTSDYLNIQEYSSGGGLTWAWQSAALYRDTSAWYHIVAAVDTTQATAANRLKLYVNGVQVTDFYSGYPTYPSQNLDTNFNNNTLHGIGKLGSVASTNYFYDGYIADFYFIDGSALDASSFGSFDDNGVWQSAAYSGTFGTNGFHLFDFANESGIGNDSSGNDNDFTVNNLTSETPISLPSVAFDGTGDSLTTASSSDFTMGTGDFTVECFVNISDQTQRGVFQISSTSGGLQSSSYGSTIALGAAPGSYWQIYGAGSSSQSSSGVINSNQWYHVAYVRSSGVSKLYVDGTEVISTSDTTDYTGTYIVIGGYYSSSYLWKGFISNFRVIKGTAQYTSNFTRPAAPLSNVTNTKLLCCQSSSSATAATVSPVTITANGDAYAVTRSDSTAANDVLFDVPTNGTQSDTGAGGEVSGNYPTWNPLSGQHQELLNGNLEAESGTISSYATIPSTIAMTSGKWYAEFKYVENVNEHGDGSSFFRFGISQTDRDFESGSDPLGTAKDFGFTGAGTLRARTNGSNSYSYTGNTVADGDILSLAFDADAGKLWIAKNGIYATNSGGTGDPANGNNPDFSGLTYSGGYLFVAGPYAGSASPAQGGGRLSAKLIANWGQRSFAYSAPSGFKALNTASLPTPTIADGSDYFDVKTWDGNGSTQSITSLEFSPDWVWIKSRTNSRDHALYDTVRGATKELESQETNAESTESTGLTAFNSDGFSLGNRSPVNASGESFVSWNWDAGANSSKTYTVTVVSDSGNKYRFDNHGTSAVTLDLEEGSTYVFDQSDSSNSGHPLRFSTTSDGTHNSGTEYTTGVTTTGTPGSAGAKTTIVVASGAPTLYYYCSVHSGMGGQVNTNSTAGSTVLSGSLDSASYDQSQTWSTYGTFTGTYFGSYDWPGVFSSGNTFDAAGSLYLTSGTGKWTLTSSIACTSEFKFYCYGNTSITLNEGLSDEVTSTSTGGTTFHYHTISFSGNIASVKLNTTTVYLIRLFVDGKALIDNGVTMPAVPSINSVVRANPEAGFSIITYTGNGSTNQTIGHSLSSKPSLVIIKSRDNARNWVVIPTFINDKHFFYLNDTSELLTTLTTYYGDHTSSVVGITGTASGTNTNASGEDYLCYAFAPVAGYSAFGSYEGNGSASDGPFVNLNFAPAFLLVKRYDSTGNWILVDQTRGEDKAVYPNQDISESSASFSWVDLVSNGFKIRSSITAVNANGGDYIYWAFASNPFSSNGGLAR